MSNLKRAGVVLVAAAAILLYGCSTTGGESDMSGQSSPIDLRVASGQSDPIVELATEVAGLLPSDEAGAAIAWIADGEVTIAFIGNEQFGEETLFEFGSITKVITANVAAQLVQEGLLDLNATVPSYLPDAGLGDEWQATTVRNLLTHTAGIASLPPNMGPIRLFLRGNVRTPFDGMDTERMLSGARRARVGDVGESWNYSNLGYALVGEIMHQVSGQSYRELVEQRVFGPLQMDGAGIDEWSSSDIAVPLNKRGRPARHWTLNAFAPAGATRGSILDAVRFLQASLEACSNSDPASTANCMAQQDSGVKVTDSSQMGLGWMRTRGDDGLAIWHNGGTGGFSTFLGFNADRSTGLVVLCNVGWVAGDLTGYALSALASASM
jgi:D-alanyl-D-alanine-carboxypeptidase/D-alanyl-D-alanine-endopeptidase